VGDGWWMGSKCMEGWAMLLRIIWECCLLRVFFFSLHVIFRRLDVRPETRTWLYARTPSRQLRFVPRRQINTHHWRLRVF